MVNLSSLLKGSILSLGLLNFSNADAQFEQITCFESEINKNIEVKAYKKSEHKGPWTAWYSVEGKIFLLDNHINNTKTKEEIIKIDEDKTISYKLSEIGHSLSKGERRKGYMKDHFFDNEFSPDLEKRVRKIIYLDHECNHKWKYLLKREVDKWSEENKGKYTSANSIIYNKIDGNNFPREIQGTIYKYDPALEKKYVTLSTILFADEDEDRRYEEITLLTYTNRDNFRQETIKKNYEENTLGYELSYKDSTRNVTLRNENQYPEIQKRIKEIFNININCQNNEVIPFLYEEFYRSSEK